MRTTFIAFSSLLSSGLLALGACGGASSGDDGPSPDAGTVLPPCTTPTAEQAGNGMDDDCDGLVDEAKVCPTGAADFRTVGEAVIAAADGTGIEVCAGTFSERFVVAGKAITIRGAGTDATVIDGAQAGTVIAVTGGAGLTIEDLTVRHGHSTGGGGAIACSGGGISVKTSAITDSRGETGGGGLYASNCAVYVQGSRFTGNEGHTNGGAITADGSHGEIRDSVFTSNSADEGGAVAVHEGDLSVRKSEFHDNTGRVHGGAIWFGADATIEDNTVSGNHSHWDAGGLWVDRHAPTVQRNTFDGNDAIEEAGGVYLNQSKAHFLDNHVTNNSAQNDGGGMRVFTCNATLERNVISGNHAGLDGGGLKDSHLPSLYIDNQITDNVTMWAGGGIEMDNDASVIRGGIIARNHAGVGGGVHGMLWPWEGGTLEDVQIIDNRASRGGGVQFHDLYHPVTLRRVTIAGNIATGEGGGLWTRRAELNVINTTISGNHAHDGGAVWVGPLTEPWTLADEGYPEPPLDPSVRFAFSVMQGNQASTGAGFHVSVPNVTVESSIIEDNQQGMSVVTDNGVVPTWRFNDTRPATFAGMLDPTGQNGNLSAAPAFTDVASGNFRLQAGSACIDAADPGLNDRDGSRADMGVYGGPDAPQ